MQSYKQSLMLLAAATVLRRAGGLQSNARASLRCARSATSSAIDEWRQASGFQSTGAPAVVDDAARALAVVGAAAPKRKKAKRLRHHRNPLSAQASQPAQLEDDWPRAAFADVTKPLTVDVGCALGGWCVASSQDSTRNFLGLELRPEPVVRAQKSSRDLGNCAFLQCNANVDLKRLLGDLAQSGAPLERVCVQFPDPHFKQKHRKRRVCTPEFAATVSDAVCAAGASIYVASDVLDVAEEMRARFAALGELRLDGDYDENNWLRQSPLAVQTERERAVLAGLGATSTADCVYRALFVPRGK